MKQFYNVFSNEKVSTLWTQITWSHLRLLVGLDIDCINYYIKIIITGYISVRQLQEKIKNNEYVIKCCSNPNIFQTIYLTVNEELLEYT